MSLRSKYEALETNTEGIKILSVSSSSSILAIEKARKRTRREHGNQTFPLSTFLLSLTEVTDHVTHNYARRTPFLRRSDFSGEITTTPLD